MKEYLFDVKFFASIRVDAKSEEEAREILRDCLICADANLGEWPNGDPICVQLHMDEGAQPLIEIDGEAV